MAYPRLYSDDTVEFRELESKNLGGYSKARMKITDQLKLFF